MSMALARLRKHFGDELLERQGRGRRPAYSPSPAGTRRCFLTSARSAADRCSRALSSSAALTSPVEVRTSTSSFIGSAIPARSPTRRTAAIASRPRLAAGGVIALLQVHGGEMTQAARLRPGVIRLAVQRQRPGGRVDRLVEPVLAVVDNGQAAQLIRLADLVTYPPAQRQSLQAEVDRPLRPVLPVSVFGQEPGPARRYSESAAGTTRAR